MLNVGLIGTGYWGPNISKSFELTGKAKVTWLCDVNDARLQPIASKYADAKSTTDLDDVLNDEFVHAVAVSTPSATHYEIANRALEAGKHVLVEKPITLNSEDAIALIETAREKQKVLMVGHVFEYNSTIHALKNLIDTGELGEIHYLNLVRTNLGPVRTDVNALWDLASHDVSIMCYLLNEAPLDVTARGQSVLNTGVEDTVFAIFAFSRGIVAHVNASWLNPRKVRQITVVGSNKMAIWNDLDMHSPIKIYDKRIGDPVEIPDTFHAYKTIVLDGGVFIPRIEHNQPLQAECEHFIDCIETGTDPQSDGYSGLRVVAALEAATASMNNRSQITPVEVKMGEPA